jgi:hypothetical protein
MSPGKSNEDIIDAWKKLCLESGASQNVGPAHYRWFICLPDDELSGLIKLIVLDRAAELNSWAFEEPRMKSEQDLYDYLENLLEMFGRGFLQINSDGSIGCCAPYGPQPTPTEDREIDLRIRSARPLFRPAVFRVLKKGERARRSDDSENEQRPVRDP